MLVLLSHCRILHQFHSLFFHFCVSQTKQKKDHPARLPLLFPHIVCRVVRLLHRSYNLPNVHQCSHNFRAHCCIICWNYVTGNERLMSSVLLIGNSRKKREAARILTHRFRAYGKERGIPLKAMESTKKKQTPKKKRSMAGRVVVIALIAIIAVLAVFVVKFIVDINNPASLFNNNSPTVDVTPEATETPVSATPEATATPVPTPTIDPITALTPLADTEFMKNKVNILVLGVDESTERENWGSFRTDTMILVTVNFETNDVNMLSIPRDSLVKIYNNKSELVDPESLFPYAKINSAFSAGGGAQRKGYDYACKTVSMTLGGIPINYYIGFNMNVVKAVVDAMGGIDYDVDVEVTMNGRKLYPGFQHLDGQGVLDYCRQRKGSSDLARIDRQQRMLMAIVAQLKTTGQIANIPQIYTAVEQNVQTNLSLTQISSLALLGARMDIAQLTRATIPNQPQTVHGLSCVLLKNEELTKLLKKVFGKVITLDPQLDVLYINTLLAAEQLTPPPYYFDEDGNVIYPPEVTPTLDPALFPMPTPTLDPALFPTATPETTTDVWP